MTDNTGYFTFDDLHIVSIFPGEIKDGPIIDLISIFVGYSFYAIGSSNSNNTIINQYYYGKVVKPVYDDTSKIYTGFKPVTVAYPIEILYI